VNESTDLSKNALATRTSWNVDFL